MHVLTPDMARPEVHAPRGEAPPSRPAPAPQADGRAMPDPGTPRPRPREGIDRRGWGEADVPPRDRPAGARRAVAEWGDSHAVARPNGLQISAPVVIGGVVGVVLLSTVATWATLFLLKTREARVADTSPSMIPMSPPIFPKTRDKGSTRRPPPPRVAAPTATPAEVSVVDLISPPEEDDLWLDPPGESDVAEQARAAASAVASKDDDAGKSLSTAEIVAESEPSVALIRGKLSSGTGFLVAPGLVATNSHVITDEFAADLNVQFVSADAEHSAPLGAELLYEDPGRDLAFLAVQTDLKPLRIARTYAFRKGEDITVIGNPGFGDGQVLENAISRGVMSTKVQIDGRGFYQLGIAINPGNSGGPVFDSSGRVIGVATLKATKQEATGFSIPVEDLQGALARMAKESPGDAEQYRSRHRLITTIKWLGVGGGLMGVLVELRRLAPLSGKAETKDTLAKIEPVGAEFDTKMSASLVDHASRIQDDDLVAPDVRRKIGEMAEHFDRIHAAYSSRKDLDNAQLRAWKQAYKRLFTDLAATVRLEIPKEVMVAFEDHTPDRPPGVTIGPGRFDPFGPRLRPRSPFDDRPPLGIPRPPGFRDRMGPSFDIR